MYFVGDVNEDAPDGGGEKETLKKKQTHSHKTETVKKSVWLQITMEPAVAVNTPRGTAQPGTPF